MRPRAYNGISTKGERHVMNGQTNSRRIIPAPAPSHPDLRSTLVNVYCAADEDVEWQWTETPNGRYVSGYRLVPRKKSG